MVVRLPRRYPPERLIGLLFVILLHAAVLWGLWQHRLLAKPQEAMTLYVNLIAPSPPKKLEEPQLPPPDKPKSIERPIEKPQPPQIAAATPVVAPSDHLAPPPPPKPESTQAPVVETPPAPLPTPLSVTAKPVMLGGELSVACPQRMPPRYPPASRRLGEEGVVVLRVEIDETGAVAHASVQMSSGHPRLDEAALSAVRHWRCTPAERNGQPVRAVAIQPFKFAMQEY